MRVASILSIIIVSLFTPAVADDADLKKQVEQIGTAYIESFNKRDAAGIAALFVTGGIFVNQSGPKTNIAQAIEGTFKAGFNHAETQVDQVWPLGSDTALGMGQIRLSGNNQSGAAIEFAAFWTATYVRDGGKWKIRMLSGIPKQPQPAR
jgi:uncharacterized protein (TIGR02246 family)